MIKGNSNIKAGDVINLYIPSNENIEETRDTFNKLYGNNSTKNAAKFLVIRVSHFYNNQKSEYNSELKVVKDSYASDIEPLMHEDSYTWM